MAQEALTEALQPAYVSGKVVLLKPNCCYPTSAGTGVVTHPETVRGAIHYLKEAGAGEIWLGDGAIYGLDTDEALEKCGMAQLAKEEDVRLLNLDNCEPVKVTVPEPMAVKNILVSSRALAAEMIISIPVMKCHMHAGVSLGLKNMKGCLWGRQKRDFHHLREKEEFAPWHAYKNIDRAIADLFSVLPPQAVLVDAVVGMEGLGPLLGQPKPMGMVLASQNPLAADLAGIAVMGFEAEDVPHILLAAEKAGWHSPQTADLNLDHDILSAVTSRFKPALAEDLSKRYPQFDLREGQTCSACPATITAFLLTHGLEYAEHAQVCVAFGKGLDPATVPQGSIMFGNCAAALKDKGEFVAGCPPVPSDLVQAIAALDEKTK
ncbi:MAG: DUF362 domain-containing protein [Desulfarculaceae bacterium]|jgi:uncharacterized protein (DUF362 family)